MAVQLPELQRTDPAQPAPAGRIDSPIANPEPTVAANTNAIADAGDAGANMYRLMKKNASILTATTTKNTFETEYKRGIYGDAGNDGSDGTPARAATLGLINQQGDPTKAYADFDQRMNKRLQDLAASPVDGAGNKIQGADPETLAYTRNMLSQVNNMLYDKRLAEYGKQYGTYQNNVADATDKLDQSNMVGALSNPDNPLAEFQNQAAVRTSHIVEAGLRNGSVLPDPNGTMVSVGGVMTGVKIGQATQWKINQGQSAAVTDGIKVLTDTGTPESLNLAKQMAEFYKDSIDPVNAPVVKKAITEADVTQQAQQAFAQAQRVSPEQQIPLINKLLGGDNQVAAKMKAIDLLGNQSRNIEEMKTARSKDNYNRAYDTLSGSLQGDPGTTPKNFEAAMLDPKFKGAYDNITNPAEKKALKAMIERPDETNISTATNYWQALRSDDGLSKLSPSDFELMKGGANKEFAAMMDHQYQSQSADSSGEQRARTANFNKMLFDQAMNSRLIKYAPGTHDLTPSSKALFNDLSTTANQQGVIPKNSTLQERDAKVKELLAQAVLKKQQAGNSGILDNFFGAPGSLVPSIGAPTTLKPLVPQNTSPWSSLNTADKAKLLNDYELANPGATAPNAAQLSDFYTKKNKK
jgi:hypothetical protein